MLLSFLRAKFYQLFFFALLLALLQSGARLTPLVQKYQTLFDFVPYLLCFLASLLALHFNRGRVMALMALLVLVYAGWGVLPQAHLVSLLTVWLPINVALIALLPERGLFALTGYGLLVVELLFAGLAWWLLAQPDLVFWRQLEAPLLASLPYQLPLTQKALVLNLLCFPILVWRGVFSRSAFEGTLLLAWVALLLLLWQPHGPTMRILVFALVALLVLVSLLQDSHRMAYRDELTGLLGRRALNEALLGLGRRYVIAMLDVDHFKKFNDTYGHEAGDQVLKMVAVKMQQLGGGSRAYRYGGEEFAVIFPRRALLQSKPHLEVLRAAIANYSMTLRGPKRPASKSEGAKRRGTGKGRSVRVTISIGACERGGAHKTSEQVMQEADRLLYQAKRKGRNCVVCQTLSPKR